MVGKRQVGFEKSKSCLSDLLVHCKENHGHTKEEAWQASLLELQTALNKV